MRRLSTALLSVALVGMALAANATACSCARQSAEEGLREADAAIVGRLVEVVPRARMRADYRYEVIRVYRGPRRVERSETLTVRSARQGAACGLPQGTGRRYGLFLSEGRGRWWGGLCGVVEPSELRRAAQGRAGARDSAGELPCDA